MNWHFLANSSSCLPTVFARGSRRVGRLAVDFPYKTSAMFQTSFQMSTSNNPQKNVVDSGVKLKYAKR